MPTRASFLADASPHPRDARIEFEEEYHKYYLDGEEVPISVSGLWAECFPHFDAPSVVEKYYSTWKQDAKSKYHQLIRYLALRRGFSEEEQKAEIVRFWSAGGEEASSAGTAMHAQIEYHLNGEEVETDAPEFGQYLAWRESFLPELCLAPYRTEWSVYDEEAKVAGQIDSLWRSKDGSTFVMVDWKRCDPKPKRAGAPLQPLGPKVEAFRNEKGLGPCSHLPNTSFYHYCVQQNLYKYIVDTHYGIKVGRMFLAQFHPLLPSFHCVEVPDMQDVARSIMQERCREVRTGEKRPKVDKASFF